MCQVSVFGDLNTTSFLQFCTASVCVHYLWWTHSWHDALENLAHLLILGLFFCFWKVDLIKSSMLLNRVEERRLQCVPSVERFSSRVSSSHFYTCRSFRQAVDSQSYIFKEHNQISDGCVKQAKRAMTTLTWRGVPTKKFTTPRSRWIFHPSPSIWRIPPEMRHRRREQDQRHWW